MPNYSSRVSLCKLSSRLTSLLKLTLRVTWHRFLQFADDNLCKCSYLRDMQLLGAHVHNFLLFQAAMACVVALLQSYKRLYGTFMVS